MLTLDQAQVDSLAAFAEACTELGNEPFFTLYEPLPNFRASENWMHVTYLMGDRVQFRAGLLPFHRIWSPADPAHWETAAIILNGANLPPQLAYSANWAAETIRREMAETKTPHRVAIPTGQIIALWLDAGVMQLAWEQRKAWETTTAQHGHAPLEFAFRSGVKTLGYQFQQLADHAVRPALALAEKELKLVPSFRVGAMTATKRREVTPDGAVVRRQGVSDHGFDESFEERYRRLLGRYDNESLGRIFRLLEASPGEIMRAVLWCATFAELLESVEGRLELTTLPWEQAGKHRTTGYLNSAASSDGIWFHLFERNVVVTAAKVVPLLDAGLLRLRQQMLAKS